jgi:hypothetical protein
MRQWAHFMNVSLGWISVLLRNAQFLLTVGLVIACTVVGLLQISAPAWILSAADSIEYPQAYCSTSALILPDLTSPSPQSTVHEQTQHPFHSAHILLYASNHGNFFFEGSTGRVAIAFLAPISISHVQIDVSTIPRHIPTALSPRRIVLWGSSSGPQNPPFTHSVRTFSGGAKLGFFEIARFDFDHTMSNDLIPIPKKIEVEVIIIEVLDNWGGSLTCLHRIRFWCD